MSGGRFSELFRILPFLLPNDTDTGACDQADGRNCQPEVVILLGHRVGRSRLGGLGLGYLGLLDQDHGGNGGHLHGALGGAQGDISGILTADTGCDLPASLTVTIGDVPYVVAGTADGTADKYGFIYNSTTGGYDYTDVEKQAAWEQAGRS